VAVGFALAMPLSYVVATRIRGGQESTR
jgi:hypothetical protein